jgi:hypothetical protein
VAERIEALSVPEPNSGCLIWLGTASNGYGKITVAGKVRWAHVVSYELAKGPVPDGLELDHLCRTPTCINPRHLEPVTHQTNLRRGLTGAHLKAKEFCPQGHPYLGENLKIDSSSGARRCRIYTRAMRRRYRASLRVRASA